MDFREFEHVRHGAPHWVFVYDRVEVHAFPIGGFRHRLADGLEPGDV
tara:strand:- start:382 stop:522 length:141 start_codon:yes stop_codon:yes gene_type:complete